MMAEKTVRVDDDEWLDWESRHPHVPMWKHMIAGKPFFTYANRLVRWHYGALRNVPSGHDQGKEASDAATDFVLVRRICKQVEASWACGVSPAT